MPNQFQSLTWLPRTVLPVLLVMSAAHPVEAQFARPGRKAVVLQTTDGMIVMGRVTQVGADAVTLETKSGTLVIPFDQLARVDGDRFDAGEGLVREHAVTIGRNGDVTLDYFVPVSGRSRGESANILVAGKVLKVEDLDGRPLAFVAEDRSGYTRCTVRMPECRLPLVAVRVLQKAAARIENDQIRYGYRYTPRSDQTFRLRLSLPAGAAAVEATPETVRTATDTWLWESSLHRQEAAVFEVSLRLTEREP